MENRKNNKKKSLIMNIMSIVLCLAMLASATFAWFSDSESGRNTIQTGNLDVALKHLVATETEGVYEEAVVKGDTQLFLNKNGEEFNWEPGIVATETFIVENQGDLALIYDLVLNADETGVPVEVKDETGEVVSTETKYLSEYLKVAFVPAIIANGTVTPSVTNDEEFNAIKSQLGSFEAVTNEGKTTRTTKKSGSLVKTEDPNGGEFKTKEAYTVVVYWEPQVNDIDNLFNSKNTGGAYELTWSIGLSATQMAHEFDSIGNGYDNNLTVPDAEYNEGNTDDMFGE